MHLSKALLEEHNSYIKRIYGGKPSGPAWPPCFRMLLIYSVMTL
jgi:hypothetical protein